MWNYLQLKASASNQEHETMQINTKNRTTEKHWFRSLEINSVRKLDTGVFSKLNILFEDTKASHLHASYQLLSLIFFTGLGKKNAWKSRIRNTNRSSTGCP